MNDKLYKSKTDPDILKHKVNETYASTYDAQLTILSGGRRVRRPVHQSRVLRPRDQHAPPRTQTQERLEGNRNHVIVFVDFL